MLQFDVSARVRQVSGKGASRSLRRSGKTPAVLYGPKMKPISLELDTRGITKIMLNIQRRNAVVNLDIADGEQTSRRHVIIKEIQTHPVKDTLTHADFYEISLDAPVTLRVPLIYKGKAKGIELGGELITSKTEIHVQGKPLDIPDNIEVDVTELDPGAALTCKDLNIPANLSLVENEEEVCISVTAIGG